MTIQAIKSYIDTLLDIAQSDAVEKGKTVSSKKDPKNVKEKVKALFSDLSTLSIDPYEKAGLCTGLASSLAQYRRWMEHNEEALSSTVNTYGKLAISILRREEKLLERAEKLLERHRASMDSAKGPTVSDQIDAFYRELQDLILIDIDVSMALPKKLSPLRVLETVEKLCSSILSVPPDQKKSLYKKLLNGMELYHAWMKKHKAVLEEKLLSYDTVQDKVYAKYQELQHAIQPVSKPQEKPKPQSTKGVFTKNFPMKMISFDPTHHVHTGFNELQKLNTSFKQAIAEIRQDKEIGQLLDVYHKREGGNQDFDAFFKNVLNQGACYGRVMAYIAQIKQNQGRKLNIESLWKNASEKDFMKNQILHVLYVHAVNRQRNVSRNIFSTSILSPTRKIEALFPVANPTVLQGKRIPVSDEKLLLENLKKRMLKNPTQNKVLIFQYSKPSLADVGHVSLMYCGKKNDDYLFYDSLSNITGGLYSANTEAALVKKSIERVLDSARQVGFTHVSLHSYNL